MFALVDCNNFYASCERVFSPLLNSVPLAILSNNDGCIVARSPEVKAMGVPMGVPWFKIEKFAQQAGIVALSSNYALYADMSDRVVKILSEYAPDIEVYSIDESFLSLDGISDLTWYGQQIRQRVYEWLRLPVCVGIAPTKTLAKLANHFAKKRPEFSGVCDLSSLTEAERIRLYSETDIGEVWGIGRRLSARLKKMRINTVEDLRRAPPDWFRDRFSVVLERTVRELSGVSCLDLEELTPPKKQIISSRSFGAVVPDLPSLREAIANHVSRAAEKLRAQNSEAGAITVMVQTSAFVDPPSKRYFGSKTVPLPVSTCDTGRLIEASWCALRHAYRPGFEYRKAGVMLSDISPFARHQTDLFTPSTDARKQQFMAAMDLINLKYGRGTLQSSVIGARQSWGMRREMKTPCYTTKWEDVPAICA